MLNIYFFYSIDYSTSSNYIFTCVIRLTCSTCMSTNLLTLFGHRGTHDVYAWNLNSHSTLSSLSSSHSSTLLLEHFRLRFCPIYNPIHWIPSFLLYSSLCYNFNKKLPIIVCRPLEPDISLWGWPDLPPKHLDPCIDLSLPRW